MVNWRRTSKNEYPKEGQICLIYFYYTKFSISKYSFEIDKILGNCHSFYDEGGFLTDEDLLWLPIEEVEIDKEKTFHEQFEIPEDYLNDRCFMKWDNPKKVTGVIKLNKDVVIEVLDKKYNFKKDMLFGKTNECSSQIICIRKEGNATGQYFFNKEDIDDVDMKYEDIPNVF